jgi:hypothetical protein
MYITVSRFAHASISDLACQRGRGGLIVHTAAEGVRRRDRIEFVQSLDSVSSSTGRSSCIVCCGVGGTINHNAKKRGTGEPPVGMSPSHVSTRVPDGPISDGPTLKAVGSIGVPHLSKTGRGIPGSIKVFKIQANIFESTVGPAPRRQNNGVSHSMGGDGRDGDGGAWSAEQRSDNCVAEMPDARRNTFRQGKPLRRRMRLLSLEDCTTKPKR